MADSYDLIVLGGGTGGYSCALRAASLGLQVALVEKEKVGGTCLHWGCIPTKACLQAAEVAEHARDGGEYGVRSSFDGMDMPGLNKYKDAIVNANFKGLQASLKSRGVDVVPGTGRLEDAQSLSVSTGDGDRSLQATRGLVLATGSKPRGVPIEGADIDGELVITSDHAVHLDRVPEHAIVLGAGAVGVEFATAWHGYGSDVTIVEMLDGLVPLEDADSRKALQKSFKQQGITSHVSTKATKVEKGDGDVRVTIESSGGEESTIEGDLLLVAIGRRPVTEDMGFEDAGVKLDNGYVTVDDYLRPGPEGLYAVGDILAPPSLGLAHASFQEGFLVAEHAAGHNVVPIDYAGVPRVTYSHPEVGSVGLTEGQCKEQGFEYEKASFPWSHNARAMMLKASGHVKVLAEKDDGRVLGVHIVGPHATDLVAEAQLIYNWEALPTEVAQFIHPHPTLSEAIGEAHMAIAGKPLHG
ncbi:dihydrolipoyl dehydrogenase [soil metagenome]